MSAHLSVKEGIFSIKWLFYFIQPFRIKTVAHKHRYFAYYNRR